MPIVNEQGTKIGRQSFILVHLDYGAADDMPTRFEVGVGVLPVVIGTLVAAER